MTASKNSSPSAETGTQRQASMATMRSRLRILRRFMKKSPFQSNSVFNIPHFAARGKFFGCTAKKSVI